MLRVVCCPEDHQSITLYALHGDVVVLVAARPGTLFHLKMQQGKGRRGHRRDF